MSPIRTAAILALTLMATGPSFAFEDDKDFIRRHGINSAPGYLIKIDVDRADRTYFEGETMTVSVTPEKDCYVYLLYYNAEGKIHCLFPSEAQDKNFVKAKTTTQVPPPVDQHPLEASAPFGDELLQVIATREPVDLFEGKSFTEGQATPLEFSEVKAAINKARKLDRDMRRRPAGVGQVPGLFAEAQLPITTRPGKRVIDAPTPPKRVGVCVGISKFKDSRIPQLTVCHEDARKMAEAFKERCGVSDVILLQDEQATLEAIRTAIYEKAVAATRPGDTVFLFFSGHGGRCADTNGDEADGLDEYIVPYDGEAGDAETMLLDDTFARWLVALDGRRVFIVLDNCYSGGASKGVIPGFRKDVKGLDVGTGSRPKVLSLDFFDGELNRAKDLGQKGTAVLAASQADQIAWEMSEGESSVLTHYVIEALGTPGTDQDGDGKVSVQELHKAVKDSVVHYVEETFKARQEPLVIDNESEIVVRRP